MTAAAAIPARRPARRSERGAALLVVIVSLAVLTAFAVDLAYQARVGIQTSANARDDLRALYEAKGAVALARLVLSFQAQIDQQTSALAQNPQLAALAPRVQIWNLVPVSSTFASTLLGTGAEPPSVGPPAGAFDAKLEDERAKVNAQLDGIGDLLTGQLAAWFDLVGDRKWDFLFDRQDEEGNQVSRNDLAVNLIDWVDQNKVTSALTGNPAKPVEDGFGDENAAYERGSDPYRVKNARFDSLDELYLVSGVSDAFMAAFRDRLTVYVKRDTKFSLPCGDADMELRAAKIMASDQPNQPAFSDASFPDRLAKAVSDATLGCVLVPSTTQYAGILVALGVAPNSIYLDPKNVDQRGAFGTAPGVYRVRARGTAGDVTKTIDAIVTMDPAQMGGQPSQLGRLLHWRED